MRTALNFILAFLLLIAFIGSAVFFVSISNGLKLKRVEASASSSSPASLGAGASEGAAAE